MRGPGPAPTVFFSCVLDDSPLFMYQSLVWLRCLLLSQAATPRAVVHAITGCDPTHLELLRSMGAEVVEVAPFDRRHPHSNKLAQLGSEALEGAEHVVLTDCDIALCGDISAHVKGSAVKGKIVDLGQPDINEWDGILKAHGLPGPPAAARASHAAVDTFANNFNGGLYILPQAAFRRLGEAWPRWNRAVIDHGRRLYADQVSFGLSIAELGLDTEPLPPSLNFPTHLPYDGPDAQRLEPLALHYHDRVSRLGMLQPTGMPGVDAAIGAVNGFISEGLEDPRWQAARSRWAATAGTAPGRWSRLRRHLPRASRG